MKKRENNFLEAYKALDKLKSARLQSRVTKQELVSQAYEDFEKKYFTIKDKKEARDRQHGRLMEAARNDALGTTIKAIYITAMEAETLTDNGIILAESLVDNWIKEKGGAYRILSECKDKTYLLNRIHSIVEDTAKDEVDEIEDIEKDDGEEKSEKKQDKKEEEKEEKKDDSSEKDDEDEKKDSDSKDEKDDSKSKEEDDEDDDEEDDKKDDDEKEDEDEDKDDERSGDPLADTDFEDSEEDETELPDDATTTEDDNETDIADDITDDLEKVPDKDITVDGNEENNGKIFDELEKEEDVQKAIALIRQRVADAEETFIRRNAEDKKQIDELIGRISDNVKTVEDMDDKESTESKIAEEAVRMDRRRIKDITENRRLSVLEKMSRNLTAGIVKDYAIREQYLDENGRVDISATYESAKVMYGFLETLNTLQLEKVDTKYIQEVLDNMD